MANFSPQCNLNVRVPYVQSLLLYQIYIILTIDKINILSKSSIHIIRHLYKQGHKNIRSELDVVVNCYLKPKVHQREITEREFPTKLFHSHLTIADQENYRKKLDIDWKDW